MKRPLLLTTFLLACAMCLAQDFKFTFGGDYPRGWTCTIKPGQGIWMERIGIKTIMFPYSKPRGGNGVWAYESSMRSDGKTLSIKVFVQERPCIDGESGSEKKFGVDIILDDDTVYSGCGSEMK